MPAQGEQEIVRLPGPPGNPPRSLASRARRPYPGAMTQVETQTEDALEILLSADLEPIVDMVLRRHDDGTYEALSHDGRVTFRRTGPGPDGYETVAVTGSNPFADTAHRPVQPARRRAGAPVPAPGRERLPLRLRPHRPAVRLARRPRPLRDPLGGPQLGGPGRSPRRARLARDRPGPGAVGHRRQGGAQRRGRAEGRPPRRRRPDRRGAPRVPARSASTTGARPTSPARTARSATTCSTSTDGRPRLVVGFLFDGTNPNVLYDMAARGEAPNVARLIEMGTAFGHGAMAGLPTVTLANHTSIITSRLPGHHGILNNAWYDRRRGEQVITNSSATWPTAMQHVAPGVESIHDAVHRSFPGEFSASVNEPCDIGADYSTFDFFRRGEVPPIPSSRPRVCRTRRSGSCARRRTTRGRRSSTTWAPSRPWAC